MEGIKEKQQGKEMNEGKEIQDSILHSLFILEDLLLIFDKKSVDTNPFSFCSLVDSEKLIRMPWSLFYLYHNAEITDCL